MVKAKKMAGRACLLAGPPGTGKTAIALAMSQELGSNVPFVQMIGSQVYAFSDSAKGTAHLAAYQRTVVLQEACRRAIAIKLREIKEVYEGELIELVPHEVIPPYGTVEGTKTVSHVNITLRTTKGTKTLKLDPVVYQGILHAKCRLGDILLIEANSGAVKRVGRADTYQVEFDLETDQWVPVPKGEVCKRKEIIQHVTLYDLDVANAMAARTASLTNRMAGAEDTWAALVMAQLTKPQDIHVSEKLRQQVNIAVDKFIEAGMGELVPGVLFIDEVHMMDMICFTYLNKLIESDLSPIIVLATNRGHGKVRGALHDLRGNYCLPPDLLDRLLVIKTYPYSLEEMQTIIGIRAKLEGLRLSPEALKRFAELAAESAMRYALGLLSPTNMITKAHKRSQIEVEDVEEASQLFPSINRIMQE